MAYNQIYLAVGEEATRGTKQTSTVGFIPLDTPGVPKIAFDDKVRKEFRGDQTVLGSTLVRRLTQKWDASLTIPFFTEAGTVKGMMGTILKHFFGHVTSNQNGTTGQYAHMMYPITDPFDSTVGLGTKALTLNLNMNQGSVLNNYPYVGARVKSLQFEQAVGEPLKLVVDVFGQYRDAVMSAIASPVFAAENLRCDYNKLKVYTGTITRTGTAPDFTQFAFGSAVQLMPDKINVKIENGMSDHLRISGLNYPDKTRMGQYKVTLELTIDWQDPASGFSSAQEWLAWIAASSQTNFCLAYDTGTQAGTGDDHGLIIDIPVAQRLGGEPTYAVDKDPMITLKYEGLFDATTCKYIAGLMLKNTATAL